MQHLIFYILILGVCCQGYAQRSSILIDHHTGQVLSSERADLSRFPASLTKVMTLYIVFEEIKAGNITIQDRLTTSIKASRVSPTKLYLKPGNTISLHDAILGMTVHSANDAAVTVAEHIGGTEDAFAERMTEKAQELGMEDSVFYNASGLPHHKHLSSARDMALLTSAMIRDHPEFLSYFSAKSFLYNGIQYMNSNKLLHRLEGVDGFKTGYTPRAGSCLIASRQIDSRRIIGVVIGETSGPRRDKVMEHLLTYNSLPLPSLLEDLARYPCKKKKRRGKIKPSAAYWGVKTGAFRTYDQAVKYSKKVGKKKKCKTKKAAAKPTTITQIIDRQG
jgi:D-alanyl-D-alanine carboxypeptidase